ncbi:glycosyltransferase [Peribacillus asahii]|uniref:glycosyltransferase n=1 Tax=Peribacillus asahii TaxID=228899 RepID=UPI00207ACA7C|nr:glycosyltransferase [Peribacillus asahii]USK84914.1 glycosyltransferase [Peribacillus asahii]
MKILCFIDNLGSGGAQRQLVNLALLFKEYGHEVKFLTYGEADFFRAELDDNHIKVDCVHSKGAIDRIIKVRKYIRSGDQDVVISFLETPNFLACLSAIGGRDWKLITNERSSKVTSFINKRGRLFKWFEKFSDAIVCNSRNAQSMWEEYYPKYKYKLSTIYNPVLLPKLKPSNNVRKDDMIHMIVAASYQYLKNMDGLIEAVNMLSDEHKRQLRIDWYGRIEVTTGNSVAYEEAMQKIERYQLKNTIFLHGTTKEVIQRMADSDFVCLFSKYEGLPNAVCEGMSLGKPIIMSRVSDYSILVDKSNGFLCNADDSNTIRVVLEKAISLSTDDINKMGESSKYKAKKLFDKTAILEQWMKLINSIEKGW